MGTELNRCFRGLPVQRLCRSLALAGLLACFSAPLPGGAESSPSPSNEELRHRISVLEQALLLRNEGHRMEGEGNVPGAMEAYRKSFVLYPDPRLEEKILSFRPDLQPLKDRIAFLESLRAAKKTGTATASAPPAAPHEGGGVSAGQDNPDWRTYPDLPAEKKAIGEVFSSFRSALKAGDIGKAAVCVDESRRETYAALFEKKPEAMPSFAALLEGAEMSFLSAPENADPGTTSTLRTSEYAVDVGGFTFYVRWVKVDGKWLLFDF